MGIVRLRSKIHVFFRCPYNPRSCFSSNFYCWCLFSSYTSFLYGIFLSSCCCVFFFVRLFFSYLFLFFFLFLLHSFSFFNKLLSVCSWCSTTFYHSFIYLFIYLLPQIYVINMMRAILLATFMPGVRQIHREDNSIVALPVNCVHLIDWWNTRNNVSQREREKVFRVLVQPPKRTFLHRRSYSLPVLQTPSESVEQRERRWPLHFCKFYNGKGHLWSHGKHFPRPGRSTMAIWYDEEYVVANLTNKTDYARAEIGKFNLCSSIIGSRAGIIFFFLPCFWKSQNRKHCNSNLLNTASHSVSLLKSKICLRWVSKVLKY